MTTIQTALGFNNFVATLQGQIGTANATCRAIEEEKRAVEQKLCRKQEQANELRVELYEYLRVVCMAGYSQNPERERKYWKWYEYGRQEASSYHKIAWKITYNFYMFGYEFYISIKERTDLKRDKFVVEVSGYKETHSASDYRIERYTEHKYIKEKYGDTEAKFRSRAEAEVHVKHWQEKLIADHKAEIDEQLAIAASVTPEQIAEAKKLIEGRI